METLGQFQGRISATPIGAGVNGDVLIGLINDRIEMICRFTDWTRLTKSSILQTVAPYETGTVSIAVGATAGTGTGTAFTSGMTGRSFRVVSLTEFYEFTFVSPTSFTIDRAYEAADDAVDATFRIWKAIYELPEDLSEILSLRNPTLGTDLNEETEEWLDRRAAARISFGPPLVYVPSEDSAEGLARIELYPAPDSAVGMPMRYKAKPPRFDPDVVDTTEEFPDWISIPCVYEGVLAGLHRLQKEYTEANAQEAIYNNLLAQMAQEDARRRPATEMRIADRYTEHRAARVSRCYGRARNWRSA